MTSSQCWILFLPRSRFTYLLGGDWGGCPGAAGGGGGYLVLNPKLVMDCETERESGSCQPVNTGHTGERSPSYCPSVRSGVL